MSQYTREDEAQFRKHAQEMTRLLRGGTDRRWSNIRKRLAEEGVDVKSAALAYLGPDDHTMEGGLVVTAKGRCFLFTLEFGTGEAGEGTGSYREAWLWDWEEVDRSQLQGYDGAAASAAEAILDDEE